MPRISRKKLESKYLHIMVQGINKEDIFKKQFYKNIYLNLLKKNYNKYNIKILAYAIMNNHAHILIYYDEIDDVSSFMHLVNFQYARFYNKNEERVGYVFRGRYKCEQIKDIEHLFTVIPYIHYNPVKANIVKYPEDYYFSSYNSYLKNDIDNENAYIIFNTSDYLQIFKDIHEKYSQSKSMKDNILQDDKEIIKAFKNKYKIKTTEIILKEKNLLLELILQLEEKTNLKDYEIARILGIGKNRISSLKKYKNKEI